MQWATEDVVAKLLINCGIRNQHPPNSVDHRRGLAESVMPRDYVDEPLEF